MSKQLNISGFIIRIGKGTPQIVRKPDSVYNEKIMVVSSYSIYNIRSTRRKLKNEDYKYIIKGHTVKNGVKADYGFYDSLLNKWVDPKKQSDGFVRIPYSGPGKYGVVFSTGHQGEKQSFIWEITGLPKPIVINKEGVAPSVLSLKIKANPVRKSNILPRKINHPNHKKKKKIDDSYYHPDNLDMLDYYTSQETSRRTEFGHGRKRREEWNSSIALDLKKELDNLRRIQKSDPNTFDRGAMK